MSVSSQRWHVEQRDKGVCAKCGWDLGKLERAIRLRWWLRRYLLKRFGLYGHTALWEMDHIVPVSEGGGVAPDMSYEEVMANLRTLCVPCHKAETAALAARRGRPAALDAQEQQR